MKVCNLPSVCVCADGGVWSRSIDGQPQECDCSWSATCCVRYTATHTYYNYYTCIYTCIYEPLHSKLWVHYNIMLSILEVFIVYLVIVYIHVWSTYVYSSEYSWFVKYCVLLHLVYHVLCMRRELQYKYQMCTRETLLLVDSPPSVADVSNLFEANHSFLCCEDPQPYRYGAPWCRHFLQRGPGEPHLWQQQEHCHSSYHHSVES